MVRFTEQQRDVPEENSIIPSIEHFQAEDGYQLAVRRWRAANPVSQVVCLHGIVSHGGWYVDSCEHLARSGSDVYFLDRRGSGLNMQARGDVDCFQTWISDVERFLGSLRSNLPRILLGISWGGKLGTAVAGRQPGLVDALGLLCPGLVARRGPRPWQRAFLYGVGSLPYLSQQKVSIPLRDPSLFTDTKGWKTYIGQDPLALRKITLRCALADCQLTHYAHACCDRIQCPLLLVLAGRDRIIANEAVHRLITGSGETNTTVIEYEQASHTLEFDPCVDRYQKDLASWIRGASRV
ncbi:MAG: transporter [Planctomycetaceae bacterium]|nr:transporter [Planctomycetaceae bacterium]MBP62048.1 transporter [Planctomycetaceae bacterium]